ncbi:MAG: RsmD family RNA methyltransferase [Saprospiraceae bacterium]|nr:RsmD family RNA methyltransferase [Saprospiraceae bacterium]
MRIIGGKFKGRRFHPPADNWPTRPTTDYAKEALFNILTNHFDFESIRVLDLFGGTGSHSYEFISRGCTDVTYVDKFPSAVQFVRKTTELLAIKDNIHIFQMDVFRFIESAKGTFDYIFAGPPYALPTIDLLPDLVLEKKLLNPEGWFVLEHNPNHSFLEHPQLFDVRNYGKTIFSFFHAIGS